VRARRLLPVFLLVRVLILLTVWLVESIVELWRESRIGCITVIVILVIAGMIVEACESC
jgi:hypothetical protein